MTHPNHKIKIMKKIFFAVTLIVMTFLSFSCKKDNIENPSKTRWYYVYAGPDHFIVFPENKATLAVVNTNFDRNLTTFNWIQISGPVATIATPNQAQSIVTLPEIGVYEFQITATGTRVTSKDIVRVTVRSLLYSDWFTLDPNRHNAYYDSSEFIISHDLFNYETNFGHWGNIALTYKKIVINGVPEYIRCLNPFEVRIKLSSLLNPFIFQFEWEAGSYADSGSTYFLLFAFNEYIKTHEGKLAFIQAVDEVLTYQFRCINVPQSVYNSLNLDWDNYPEVVATLKIEP